MAVQTVEKKRESEVGTLHIRVRNDIRAAAQLNAEKIGMPLSTIVNCLLNRLAVEGRVPFDLTVPVARSEEPNEGVYEALQELRAGKGVRCSDLKDMYKKMGLNG